MDLSYLRKEYQNKPLRRQSLTKNPYQQLSIWLTEAEKLPLANAMTLATSNNGGKVSSRVVLLQSIKDDKIYFYSNYHSQKAADIIMNPQVCLSFFWQVLERQVILKGIAKKTVNKVSTTYFADRPRPNQLSAWASKQSQVIANRAELEQDYQHYQQQFYNKTIPCPNFWGGYEFSAIEIEFFQSRQRRLHDRFLYQKIKNNWEISRLAP